MSGEIDWKQRSLSDLKAAAASSKPQMLTKSITYYQTGADAASQAQDDFMVHANALGDAWQGDAAQAAIADAKQAQQTMRQTHSSATTSSSKTQTYSQQMQDQQQQVEAVPNVDTSWGHAAKTGGWGGLVGIGVAKAEQQHHYDQNRDQAAQVVQKMDTSGQQHASDMKSVQWPQGQTGVESPPSTLPPVPGARSGGGGGGSLDGGYPGSSGSHTGGPAYTPAVMGPGTSTSDGQILNGPKGPQHPNGPSTTPQGNGTKPPDLPTVPQGGGNGSPTPVGSAPGGPVEGLPAGASGAGNAGAAAAVLGGAGLLGAGALGGRAGFAGLGANGGRFGGPAGEGERLGARGGAGAGEELGSGRGLGAGRGAGTGEGVGEGEGFRGRAGLGTGAGAPEEGLGAREGGMLRTGAGSGFAGEPVAAEAGRMGGYPMGGAGGRRRSDDEEAPVPDYLVETDDVWGDGASAAPAVIGE